MCRHTLKPHSLVNVARCACRHIGAQRSTTRSNPRWALAPGTASPGLSNARLTQSRPGAPPSPGPRVCAPGRASRPCSAPALPVLRRLSHRPGQARRIAACGPRAALEGPPAALTPTALGRYRLPLLAPPHGTRSRASPARECVGQDRAARHCAAALRKLRATAQSRYLVNHRPQTARPALAPGTASPGLSNARLTQTPRWCTSRPRPRVCAPKRAARYCDAAPSTALRKLRAAARAAPQNRFCGQRAAVEAFGFRSAFGKAGSHSQRSACVSQSAGALSPKDTARFASC
jgi:hypothetical protein